MLIQRFMENYKKAWETSDEHLLASLFTEDGRYHNTPFAVQVGHEQIKQYWQRTKLQADIKLSFLPGCILTARGAARSILSGRGP